MRCCRWRCTHRRAMRPAWMRTSAHCWRDFCKIFAFLERENKHTFSRLLFFAITESEHDHRMEHFRVEYTEADGDNADHNACLPYRKRTLLRLGARTAMNNCIFFSALSSSLTSTNVFFAFSISSLAVPCLCGVLLDSRRRYRRRTAFLYPPAWSFDEMLGSFQ